MISKNDVIFTLGVMGFNRRIVDGMFIIEKNNIIYSRTNTLSDDEYIRICKMINRQEKIESLLTE